MLKMLIYGVKAYTPQATLVHCKETGLGVKVEKAENMYLFHEQHAAQNMYLFHEQHAAQNMYLFHEQHAAQNHNK